MGRFAGNSYTLGWGEGGREVRDVTPDLGVRKHVTPCAYLPKMGSRLFGMKLSLSLILFLPILSFT